MPESQGKSDMERGQENKTWISTEGGIGLERGTMLGFLLPAAATAGLDDGVLQRTNGGHDLSHDQ